MIKHIFLYFLLSCVVFGQETKINIAIMDLDPTNIGEEESKFLSDRLRIELFESGSFNVVERDKMNAILNEQGFQMSGCSSLECAVEIGQLLNVNQMVGGSIGLIGEVYSITLRLIDVQTGAIIRTAKRDYNGKLSSMLTEVIPEISNEIAQKKVQSVGETITENQYQWGIQLRLGAAAYGLINSLNEDVSDINKTFDNADLPEYSQFSTVGINLIWEYDQNWRYNIGFSLSRLIEVWDYRLDDWNNFDRIDFERNFTFTNIYIGADYKIPLANDFLIYLGADVGFNSLVSAYDVRFDVNNSSSLVDFRNDESFSYVTLALKLKGGLEYLVSESYSIVLELSPLIQSAYDTKGEYPDYSGVGLFREALFQEKMDGSGIIAFIALTYHF